MDTQAHIVSRVGLASHLITQVKLSLTSLLITVALWTEPVVLSGIIVMSILM